MARLHDTVDEILPGIIADRRFLHENPELGFQEIKTSKFVAERLASLGVEDIRTGINQTGVTGLIRGTGSGAGKDRVVLVRADMDALPILEANEVEYKSQVDGTMHACGHDAHTAILLGLARVLIDRRDQFAGTVKVLFQPAEELPPGGAEGMIREGVLDAPHVDAVFGLHMAQDQPVGKVSVGPGPVMAAADGFKITIQGKGGHAAYPSYCVDPIVAGAQIIVALQTLVSRETDPTMSAVISTSFFNSGDAFNVIPDIAELGGTVRTFDPELRTFLQKRIPELVEGVAASLRAEVDVVYTLGYPATVNDPAATEIVREAVREVLGDEHLLVSEPKMGGEDFSYFLNERPGAFFFVGSNNEEKGLIWGHHHPRFDIDEESLGIGLETMAATVTTYLERGL
ncbi:MAG: amidohydrolase [Chloroflexia bacterium]|nr:amidohydrolase [Chloroflexia bacterium]